MNRRTAALIGMAAVLLLFAGAFCGAAAADDTIVTIKFNANGGGEAMADQIVTIPEGQTEVLVLLNKCTFTAPSATPEYKFLSWKVNNTTYYTDQEVIRVTGNLTLTAQWSEIKTWDGSTPISNPGYYKLSDDKKNMTAGIIVSAAPVVIDLNGHILSRKSDDANTESFSVLTVSSDGVLTITDSSPDAAHTPEITYTNPITGAPVIVTGGVITGGSTERGGGVCVGYGTFTMNGGTIIGNTSTNRGGGVYVENGTFTMISGNIIGNNSDYGNGVHVCDGTTFAMTGGNIIGNKTGDHDGRFGGGVYVRESTFIMNEGNIGGNHAGRSAGGVYVSYKGTFIMNGGKIIRNSVGSGGSSEKGGGVCVGAGTFIMNGGSITDNSASGEGGGVYVYVDSTFIMNGGYITNNNTHAMSEFVGGCGGGVYVNRGGTFFMNGGSITNNGANKKGGGVYVSDGEGSTFNVSGTPVIKDNGIDGAVNNVYLEGERYITVTGQLKDGEIYITNPTGDGAKFAQKGTSHLLTYADAASFFNDNNRNLGAGLSNDRDSLSWEPKVAQLDPVHQYSTVQEAVEKAGTTTPEGEKLGTIVTMTADSVEPTINVGKEVTLNLNGHTLSGDGSGSVLHITNGGNFTLCDSRSNGKITGGTSRYGGGAEVEDGGLLTLKSGTLTGNFAEYGSGVYVAFGGNFTISGGSITGNTAESDGGGVFSQGSFVMSDGRISGNTAKSYGGGVSVYGAGTFEFTGGTIELNSAKNGGGVYSSGDKFLLSDNGVIQQNTAEMDGGGIYIDTYGKFSMSGGTVSANTAVNNGGGILIRANSTLSGGKIVTNTAQNGSGAGVFASGTFNVSKSPVIKDNKKGEAADNVYLSDSSLLHLTDVFAGEIHITKVAGAVPAENDQFGTTTRSAGSGEENFIADGANLAGSISDGKLIWKKTGPVVTYTVKFDMQNHGTAIPEVKVDSGKTVTKPADPTAAGYTFGGWFKEAACTNAWDFDKDTVTKDTTLYAKWTPVIYNITVSSDDHGDVSAPPSAAAGATVRLFVQPHEGYEFDKWEVKSGGISIVNNEFRMPSSDVEIVAHFKAKQYTVTYDGNGASKGQSPAAQTCAYGSSVTLPENTGGLSKTGFNFTGWNSSPDGKGKHYKTGDSFTVKNDTTLYADWKEKSEHSIHISTVGEGSASSKPPRAIEGTVVTLTATAAEGYEFDKWEVKSGGITIIENKFTMPDSDVSIVAHFKKKQYTVTYDGNEADSGKVPAAQTCAYGSSVTVSGNTGGLLKTGFSFDGWNTKKDGSGQDYKPGALLTVKNDITLHADWKEKSEHSIHISTVGEGTASSNPPRAIKDTVVTLTATAAEGYEFDKWEVKSGEITIVENKFTMPDSDVSIVAHFKAKQYTVTYDGNEADSGTAPAPQTCAYGSSVTVSGNTGGLSKTGFSFDGWNTKKDGSGQDYKPDALLTVKNDITLYADWKEKTKHAIHISIEGQGTAYSEPAQAIEGTTVLLTAKEDTGYHFDGWTVVSGGIIVTDNKFIMPDSEVELLARFTPNNCTVTYDGNDADSGKVPAGPAQYPFGTLVRVMGNTGGLIKDGYHFTGWNTQKDGKGIDYPVGSTFTITDDITLFADWTEKEKYSIAIQTFGPGVVTSNPASASEGELVRLHVSADPGYQLTQWYVYPESIKIRDDMTFRMPGENVYFYGLFDKKGPEPSPTPKKSSDQGSSYWATPEPTETPTPTATPTAEPTPAPTQEMPTVKPVATETPAGKSPMPIMGLLAGLGAAAAVAARMRRR